MIFDTVKALLEKNLDARLSEGLRFLQHLPAGIETEKHEIGSGLFVMIDAYDTVPAEERQFEAHRKHIDIQMVIRGAERVDWCPLSELSIEHTPYHDKHDYGLYMPGADNVVTQSLTLTGQRVAVFYPSDGHRPGLQLDGPSAVKKAVVKVPV